MFSTAPGGFSQVTSLPLDPLNTRLVSLVLTRHDCSVFHIVTTKTTMCSLTISKSEQAPTNAALLLV